MESMTFKLDVKKKPMESYSRTGNFSVPNIPNHPKTESVDPLKDSIKSGAVRIEVAQKIITNSEQILARTLSKVLFPGNFPEHAGKLPTIRQQAALVRALNYVLQVVTYAIAAGDTVQTAG